MARRPIYFANAAELRRWFARHAATSSELLVGYMKCGTGVPSIGWPESVDEALCVGWIDGVRRRIDDERYQIRFTPRRRGSHWSRVNIRRMAVLKAAGRVNAAGLAAFAARSATNSGRAAYEQKKSVRLSPAAIRTFKRNAVAWKYFSSLPPGYKRLLKWWVMSARRPDTHARRLKTVVAACARKKRLDWGARVVRSRAR